jgi:ADP-ribosylglycohydrolase
MKLKFTDFLPLCQAIIEAGGHIGPDQYAQVWLDRLNPDRLFVTERLVLEKLRLGMSPWETGRGQLAADAAIMAIAPVGVINAAEPPAGLSRRLSSGRHSPRWARARRCSHVSQLEPLPASSKGL